MGKYYYKVCKYEKGIQNNKKCKNIWKKVLKPDHPDLAAIYNSLGSLYSELNENEKALEHYEKCKNIWEKVLKPDHPDLATIYNDLATIYNNLGLLYSHLNENEKALEHYEKCKNIWEKVLKPDHPDLARIYNNLGNLYFNLNENEKALEHYEKCKNIREKVLKPDHPDLATIYNNLGLLYKHLNENEKALEHYEKCKNIEDKISFKSNNSFSILSQDLIKKPKIRNQSATLPNKGNTCYINSCLQILSHLPISFSNLTNYPQLNQSLKSTLKCMKNKQSENINKHLEAFVSDLHDLKLSFFKPNTPGDAMILLLELLNKSNYLIKWTRIKVWYHKENPLEHALEIPYTSSAFTLSKISRVTVDKLNEVLQSNFFGYQKNVSGLCKKCDRPYLEKIKNLKLGKVLIFKANENELELNIDEIKELKILNFTYKLTTINIIVKNIENNFHTYCICNESDEWFEYNDHNKELISNRYIMHCKMLIYALSEISNNQASEQLVNALPLEPGQLIELISIRCYLIKKNEIINKNPMIFLIPKNHTYSDLKAQIISTIYQNFLNIKQDIKLYIWRHAQESIDLNIRKSVKSKLSLFPGHQLEENGVVANLAIDKNTYIIAKIIELNPISYKLASLPSLSQKGLTGLQSVKYNYYMNSDLQCLSNTLGLTEYIISGQLKIDVYIKHQKKYKELLVYSYMKLIKQIWIRDSKFINPISFKSSLNKHIMQSSIIIPRDPQETLTFIINKFHEELNKAPDLPQEETKKSKLPELEKANKDWEKHMQKNSSIIADLFHGQYRSEYKCHRCQSKKVTFEISAVFDLPLKCTQQYRETQEIIVEDKKFCDICQKNNQGTISLTFYRPPPNLIISIKMLENNYSIEGNEILKSFPIENMILTTYTGEKACYDLYAVNNYFMSLNKINYKAIAKNIDGNWYEFSNMFVTRINDMNSIITSKTCILFYKRKDT
ncbi:hypothetical protein SteCoe_37575 [Stentor coeruleus]|uniref:USP domain-containing protein n=1 Tax=Stentor coeruleus TaxID=5963 RepID=A0A1R2AMR3_9CILI|nr:hypothetical protein SteCoe_37575 [Stentor coeruleus]